MAKRTRTKAEIEFDEQEVFEEVDATIRTRDYELRKVKLKRYKGPGRPPNIFPRFSKSPEAKKLYKWFFKKLMSHIPTELEFMRRLEILFLSNQRRVTMAYCVNEINKMPGLLIQEDGTFRPPTTREQKFSKGSPIFIRMDSTMPNRIDIEKAQFPGIVFVLTSIEYNSILHNLEEITRCNKLLDPSTLMRKI